MSQILVTFVVVLFFSHSLFAKDCTYEFNKQKTVISGTGFKTSDKTGVTGAFPGFKVNKLEKMKDPKKLLDGLVVTVDLVTLDSGNSLRDMNLRETLFSNILGDSVAEVTVKEVTKDKIKTSMKINEKVQELIFNYKLENDTYKADGKIDILSFALNDQFDMLKKRCGSLHTGDDGKSVTWSEFNISLVAPLKKVCK